MSLMADDLKRATAIIPSGYWPAAQMVGTVTLIYADRCRRRIRLTDDSGKPFLLDLDPAVAKERRADEGYDRYEADAEFQAKVRRLYGELVREDLESAESEKRPARFTRVDADRAPELITASIVEGIRSITGR